MSETKYAVYPGWVFSQSDGDSHFISSGKLMRLYGVNPDECIIMKSNQTCLHGIFKGLIPLFPRYDGHYHLKEF